MEILGVVLMVIGVIIFLSGSIRFLIAAFQANIWWGLGVLFIPLGEIVFLGMHFREAWPPTKNCLLGTALSFVGAIFYEGIS